MEPMDTQTSISDVRLSPALSGRTYREPVQVITIPGNQEAVVIIERSGRMLKAPLVGNDDDVILDLRRNVFTRHSEEGLLSAAFDPSWPERPYCYVYRSLNSPRRMVLSRFTHGEDGLDIESEKVILEIAQPWGNHNGGTVLFGPDGMLYLSVGDGGSANDPYDAGQRMDTLLGKVLRIDVRDFDSEQPYRVPDDNPFVGVEGARDEIWASGLRNVWRMSFDSETGDLWAGDVGQNAWEEVDLITRGGNYGWNRREGKHAFRGGDAEPDFIEPIIEYGRDQGGSITGGVVDRTHDQLNGVYIYGDYMSGKLWGARRHPDGTVTTRELTSHQRWFPTSFGHAPDGTVLMCAVKAPYQRQGYVLKIEPAGSQRP